MIEEYNPHQISITLGKNQLVKLDARTVQSCHSGIFKLGSIQIFYILQLSILSRKGATIMYEEFQRLQKKKFHIM
jgi:hypothetical protein